MYLWKYVPSVLSLCVPNDYLLISRFGELANNFCHHLNEAGRRMYTSLKWVIIGSGNSLSFLGA